MTASRDTFGAVPEAPGLLPKLVGMGANALCGAPKAAGAFPLSFDALPALDPRVLAKGFFTGPVSAAAALSTDRGKIVVCTTTDHGIDRVVLRAVSRSVAEYKRTSEGLGTSVPLSHTAEGCALPGKPPRGLSSRQPPLLMPHHTTWAFAGQLAVVDDHLAGHQGGQVTLGPLNQATGPRRQISYVLGIPERQTAEIDQVDICSHPRKKHSSVGQSVEVSGILRQTTDGGAERDPRTTRPIPYPVRQKVRGHAGIADDGGVGSAVSKSLHGQRVRHHLVEAFVRPTSEVGEWQ